MGLLGDIEESAVSSSAPITDLLRKCKVLAVRSGASELGAWADKELNGYDENEELPPYRVSDVNSIGIVAGPFGRLAKNVPIPPSNLPKEFRHFATSARMREPISAYEQLLTNKDAGVFQSPWPPDLVKMVAQDIYEGMALVSAWQQIPRALVVSLVDGVRNRVLNFALELQSTMPDIGDVAASGSKRGAEADAVRHAFVTNIYGNVGNYAAGNRDVNQSLDSMISEGDDTALTRELSRLGFGSGDVDALQTAVQQDAEGGKRKFGRAVGEWLGRALGKAGTGALTVGVDVAMKVLPAIINQYLGLPAS